MNWVVWLIVFGITLGAFVLVIIGMAIGVMFGRPKLTGSCGGLANLKSPDSITQCSLCTHADEGCKERLLQRKSAVL